jgi:hypothetical protein
LGALVTWAIASGKDGFFKKFTLSLSGVVLSIWWRYAYILLSWPRSDLTDLFQAYF